MLLIKNGRVVDPASNIDGVMNVLIKDGKIDAIYETNNHSADVVNVIDATDKIVSPGLIDCHVHFREPGFKYKETIETGSKSAVKSGFTSVICEPNTKPAIDSPEMAETFIKLARKHNIINLYTKACMTKGSFGEEVTNVKLLRPKKWVAALSDDGNPITNNGVCEKAFSLAKEYNYTVSPHCEDSAQSLKRVDSSSRFTNPPFSNEANFVARDIEYAEKIGARLHISHISLKESIELVRKAKQRNLTEITCEAAPHHLILDNEFVDVNGVKPEVNPPLRSKKDVLALQEALLDNTIDVIASDHAPHSFDDKKSGACGLLGMETSPGLILTEFVDKGRLTMNEFITKMSWNPAIIFGLTGGIISIGKPADITIIDPAKKWVVNSDNFESKSRNCPFEKWQLKGMACCTIVGGKILMRDGKLC